MQPAGNTGGKGDRFISAHFVEVVDGSLANDVRPAVLPTHMRHQAVPQHLRTEKKEALSQPRRQWKHKPKAVSVLQAPLCLRPRRQ